MSKPFYADEGITLWRGDALEVLRELPAESVDCVVTSPPYYGLRDYGEPGQYGMEDTPFLYVEQLRAVFAEARRVLAADGTLWLNVGDSYNSTSRQRTIGRSGRNAQIGATAGNVQGQTFTPSLPVKSLLGIPWRVAFALQDDGWVLRDAIIWHKPNAMPESVTDRPSGRYEFVFLLAKQRYYHFDLDPLRVDPVPHKRYTWQERKERGAPMRHGLRPEERVAAGDNNWAGHPSGSNPGNVWTIPTVPFPGAHFAVMPPALAERCIVAGCRSGGVVLDPFCGSGTTGMVALKHGRRFVGIDLSAKYLDLALKTRLAQTALPDEVAG